MFKTTTATETLIAAKLGPAPEQNWNDFNGDIAAEAFGALLDEIERRANEGDPVAISHLRAEKVADIRHGVTARTQLGDSRADAIAEVAVGWAVSVDYVERVLALA